MKKAQSRLQNCWSAEIYMVWRTADLLKWSKQQNESSLYNYTNIQQFTQEKKGLSVLQQATCITWREKNTTEDKQELQVDKKQRKQNRFGTPIKNHSLQ